MVFMIFLSYPCFTKVLMFYPVAIRKTQRDTSSLVERNFKNKATEKHVTESSSSELKLEHELRSQWRSLFQYMEAKVEHEANQLVSVLLVYFYIFLYMHRASYKRIKLFSDNFFHADL